MYPQLHSLVHWFRTDGRHFQIASQLSFLVFGIASLGWDAEWANFLCAFSGCLAVQALAVRYAGAPASSIKSAIITSLGLCLLLKANSPVFFFAAALLAIGQKFLIRWNGRHLWNPANFGIVAVILLTGQAWISPGQWGSSILVVFLVATSGLAVLSKVRRLETGFVFLLTFLLLDYGRTILYLGWDHAVWFHKLGSGSLWLFALFMITDPMTTPHSRAGRMIWAFLVGCISFYLAAFHFLQTAPFWVLFFATPLTPVFDYVFAGKPFEWIRKTELKTSNQ